MNLRKLVLYTTMVTVILAAPLTWLLTTNSGLKAVLGIARHLAPVKFDYAQVNGEIIGRPIELRDATIEYAEKEVQIEKLVLDWQLRSFSASKVRGVTQFLPQADLLADQHLVLDTVQGQIKFANAKQYLTIKIAANAAQTALNGTITISHDKEGWDLEHAILQNWDNIATIKQNSKSYIWDINVVRPQVLFSNSSGALHAYGVISNLHSTPRIQAQAIAKSFIVQDYQIKNLHAVANITENADAPLAINIAADNIILEQYALHHVAVNAVGSLAVHTINASVMYNETPVTLNVQGTIHDATWHGHNVVLQHKQEQLAGTATYNFQKRSGLLDLHGILFKMQTQAVIDVKTQSEFNMTLNMQANPQNYLNANLKLQRSKLNGAVDISVRDLTFLTDQIPYITRLKGNFSANAKIAGDVTDPIITSEAHITELTATLPALGVKIKPMELHLIGDRHGKFTLNGKGQMRSGSGEFTMQGFIEPFNEDLPNAINIIGSRIEFVNNQTAHLIASNNLNLHYAATSQRLDLTGDVTIHEGSITFADQSKQTVKSKDVVFIDASNARPQRTFNLNPNIDLRIDNGVRFNGFDLNTVISGKLIINNRHGALYGDGRITLKEGTYQLPGQKLAIHKGRLLYPTGTLLVNPMLDIKMHDKAIPGVAIIVQGTAQKPLIREQGLSNNQNRAISQAVLTSSNMIAGNLLQDKLKISEIGITSNDEQHIEFFDDPKVKDSIKNKNLVLGRRIGKRLYLQYLHSMNDDNQRVRLKYALNPIWSIGVESGTQGGGVDLSFVIER